VLPDGLFSNQKSQFGYILEGLRLDNLNIFYDHKDYFTDIWDDILSPFGTFCVLSVNFSGFGVMGKEKSGNPAPNHSWTVLLFFFSSFLKLAEASCQQTTPQKPSCQHRCLYVQLFVCQRPLVPLRSLGPPFLPIILFGSTTLLTGMTSNSLHMQWPLTSQLHGSVSEREQLVFCYGSNYTPSICPALYLKILGATLEEACLKRYTFSADLHPIL
jgi:hypothetical protein